MGQTSTSAEHVMRQQTRIVTSGGHECLIHAEIRWILFDAVGTLIYADPPVADVYHAASHEFGSRLTVDEIRRRFASALSASRCSGSFTNESQERERWRLIVSQVIDDVPGHQEAIFERLWNHFGQPRHWRLYNDVAGAFGKLTKRGYRLGIASNFDARLRQIVAGHPPLAACNEVFVSSEVGFTKPDLRFFRTIEDRLRGFRHTDRARRRRRNQ